MAAPTPDICGLTVAVTRPQEQTALLWIFVCQRISVAVPAGSAISAAVRLMPIGLPWQPSDELVIARHSCHGVTNPFP
jgi:hypothetical protein